MHQDEPAVRFDHLAHMFTGRVIRSDGRADRDAAVLGDLRSNVADAPDVDVTMFFRESEFRRQVLANQVAVEHCDRTSADFQELGQQNVGDGRLARTRKSGEENRHALFVPWRKAAAQFLHDFRISEPCRECRVLHSDGRASSVPEMFSTCRIFLDFIVRNVLVFILEVHHHAEGHHGDADFGFVLLESFLRLVGAVERLAVGILAGTGMVAADDEVGAAVILADERVPDRFARAAHAHCQRQQRELRCALRDTSTAATDSSARE